MPPAASNPHNSKQRARSGKLSIVCSLCLASRYVAEDEKASAILHNKNWFAHPLVVVSHCFIQIGSFCAVTVPPYAWCACPETYRNNWMSDVAWQQGRVRNELQQPCSRKYLVRWIWTVLQFSIYLVLLLYLSKGGPGLYLLAFYVFYHSLAIYLRLYDVNFWGKKLPNFQKELKNHQPITSFHDTSWRHAVSHKLYCNLLFKPIGCWVGSSRRRSGRL